jgi:hypothetical protein
VLLATLTLTGCSSASHPAASSSSASSSRTVPVQNSSVSYTADDLVAILKTAQASLGIAGTIKDNAQLKAAIAGGGSTGANITQALAKAGGTFAPAVCGKILDTMTSDASNYGEGATGIAAELQTTDNILAVSTSSQSGKAKALATLLGNDLNQLESQCSKLTINIKAGGKTESLVMKISKFDASTDAPQSYGFEEDITIPGAGVEKTASIEAVDGNLYISDMALANASIASLVKGVNAIVAASK